MPKTLNIAIAQNRRPSAGLDSIGLPLRLIELEAPINTLQGRLRGALAVAAASRDLLAWHAGAGKERIKPRRLAQFVALESLLLALKSGSARLDARRGLNLRTIRLTFNRRGDRRHRALNPTRLDASDLEFMHG